MATTAPQFEATQTPKTTYRAAVVHDFEGPLTVEQVAPRELEPGQVRVKVEASGLCHTDIHAAHGDWPVKPSPPFVPGHEGVGIVDVIWRSSWRASPVGVSLQSTSSTISSSSPASSGRSSR